MVRGNFGTSPPRAHEPTNRSHPKFTGSINKKGIFQGRDLKSSYGGVMSDSWLKLCMNESCHTYEWGTSHLWIRHVTRTNGRIPHETSVLNVTHDSFLWMSHVTHINETCHINEWVMLHIWMSHVTTVFGKHFECIAQKCTHFERLPPLTSHLLLPSHCVLTRHGA